MSTPVIEFDNITYSYPQSNRILNINHWQVHEGKKLFIAGDSGCGKSTLLNVISGILVPTSGCVSVLGQQLNQLSSARRDVFRAQNVGVVSQSFNLIPYLSVLKNIELACYFAGSKTPDLSTRVQAMLSRLHLSADVLHQPVTQLSVGQQQRVAIARALINKPRLLLVDEPTSALDKSAAQAFIELLLEIAAEEGTTMLFVSHDSLHRDKFDSVVAFDSLNTFHTKETLSC
ncbi:MAG: ABC transporter ATP-binding protein [Psychrobium sp.]